MSGPSAQARNLKISVERAANTRKPVLVYGEPGAGKETVARLIHENLQDKGKFVSFYIFEKTEEAFLELLTKYSKLGPKSKRVGDTIFLDGVDELSAAAQRLLAIFLKNLKAGVDCSPRLYPLPPRIF